MSKGRKTPEHGPRSSVTPEIRLPEVIYFPELAESSQTTQSHKSKAFAKAARARTVAMSSKSARMPLASIPLNDSGRKLLLSVLAGIETLPGLGDVLTRGTTWELVQLRDKGIPYQPAQWDNTPLNEARRQAYSRAAVQLENRGVLRRITEPYRDRVTHVQLTATGLRLALRLAGRHADRLAIAEGLRLTPWGKELAGAIRVQPRRDKQAPRQ